MTIIPQLPPVPPLTAAGFQDPVWAKWLTILQLRSANSLIPANNLSDLTDIASARINLGLGTMATENSNSVSITGGGVSGVTLDGSPIGGITPSTGDFTIVSVVEGANRKQGVIVLAAGVAVVSNTSVTSTSRIFLTSQLDGGTPGFLRVSSRIPGTSFTITSGSLTDTSTVAYEIFEVG